MKNIVCPISTERVQEHLPRITAAFVISLLGVYLFTGSVVVLLLLFVDFASRGIGFARFSLLHIAANGLSKRLNLKSAFIDKAPKVFSARLGALLIGLAIVFELLLVPNASIVIAILISVFATLESVANFCVGCHFYSLIVLPIFSHRN